MKMHIALASLCFTASSLAHALDLAEVQTPMDAHESKSNSEATVYTVRDILREEGNFALGAALLTIGRTDLTGLNTPLNSFDTGTLEVPVGGRFNQNTLEEPASFSFRFQNRARGDNRIRRTIISTN